MEAFITDGLPVKQWYCSALQSDGQTSFANAESADAFKDILEKSTIAWVDFRTDEYQSDVKYAANQLGFSDALISSFNTGPRNLYEDLTTELGIKLPSIQIKLDEDPIVFEHTTLVLIREGLILTIHPVEVDRRYSRLRRYFVPVLRKIATAQTRLDKLALLLMRIIETNNDRNFEHLREIEGHGDTLNRNLMDPKTPRNLLGPQIYNMKHGLIIYLDALWGSIDVIRDLRYGDADLITDDEKILERMAILAEDVNHQISLAEHLSDVLASGLEVLQTIYNNQLQVLNNRLALIVAYLTVIGTALLVPNTLATILGNSAFAMSSKDVPWYLILLVSSTILATLFTFWLVNRAGLLPKKVD